MNVPHIPWENLSLTWITVAGLVADILGFMVLAWDILPEYRIYRLKRLTALFHEPTTTAISTLWAHRNAPSDPLGELARDMAYISPFQSFRRSVGLRPFDLRQPTNLIPDLLVKSKAEVTDAIHQKEVALHSRWRPPLRLGITLVVLGFALQTAGTIATMK